MLRGLSSYYYKEPTLLFLVRMSQGLVHMGKGLLNLAPKHADGTLISGTATSEESRAHALKEWACMLIDRLACRDHRLSIVTTE